MGLLLEIQNDALDDKVPVATLLRKVMVLASNLDSAVLEDWVRHELNGYPNSVDVPKYRTMGISFKASGADIIRQYNRMPIAQLVVEKAAENPEISTFKCRQAIGTISVDEINKSDGTLLVNFDNYIPLIQQQLEEGIVLFAFWGEIPSSQVYGVLDAVRSRVLDFALVLKKNYPEAAAVDGLITKSPEVDLALTQIYNTTIHGDNAGPVGNNAGASISMTINKGNKIELREVLSKHGVDEADILELEAALVDEPVVQDAKALGPKVAGWIGKMAGKAASGAWNIGISVGTTVIQSAILAYYGLSG